MSIKKYFGDRNFYRSVLAISVPMMVQNGITNFVNLLDNIMVGRLSTEAMSGVSIVNQYIFIFNLVIFGAISAAGIFTAQYFGCGDIEGVRNTYRFKLMICAAVGVVGIVIFLIFGGNFIDLFLNDGSEMGDLLLTHELSMQYLRVMLVGLIPLAISQAIASTLRETKETVIPMAASISAVVTNFILNYILIFGSLGAPKLGIVGAAIATVTSRFVELSVLIVWMVKNPGKCEFSNGVFKSVRIPKNLLVQITVKGLPLMFNELFWSLAVTMRNQCYSMRGLDVVAAQNISTTVSNLFNVVYLSLGSAVAILIGNLLGAGKMEEARETGRRLLTFAVMCGLAISIVLVAVSPLFPKIYKTTDTVRGLASYMIVLNAAIAPFCAFAHSSYFMIRSGGNVLVTILFDSVFMWTIVMPTAYILAYHTSARIYVIFAACEATEMLKAIFGAVLVRRGNWMNRLV